MLSTDISPARRDELLEKMARRIVEMRITPLAVVMLESSKPLSFVGSQLMVFLGPIITAVFPFQTYDEIAALFEERENVELFIRKIEQLEDDRRNEQRTDQQNSGH